MKKFLFTLLMLCSTQLWIWAQTGHEWNFSIVPWYDNPEFFSNTTVDGLTVYADQMNFVYTSFDPKISVQANYKQALFLGGPVTAYGGPTMSIPLNHAVSFNAKGICQIQFTALSLDTVGTLIISDGGGSYQEVILPASYQDPYGWGTNVPVMSTLVDIPGPGTIYFYSKNANIRLYNIVADNVDMPAVQEGVTFNAVVPAGTKQCWVTGTFDDWDNTIGQMHRIDETHYTLTLPIDQNELATMEYKYLSGPGDWAFVEKDGAGNDIPNRHWTPNDTVRNWSTIYDPGIPPVEKDVTIEVFVPLDVNSMYLLGSMNDWFFDEGSKMDYAGTFDSWKKFSKTFHTPDANYLVYQFCAGASWDYGMTFNKQLHYEASKDVMTHYIFGFWQYEGYGEWVKDWNISNYWNQDYTWQDNIDGLKIYATEGYVVSTTTDQKKLEQQEITKVLKLPKAKLQDPEMHGAFLSGGVGINVGDTCQIAIACLTNDDINSGEVLISDGTDIIGVFNAPVNMDNTLSLQIYDYWGPAKELFIYTNDPGGVNIYYLGTSSFRMHQEQQLTYTVQVPVGTPQVYMAGEFNNWQPDHWMEKIDSTHFTTTLWGVNQFMQYKFCAGNSWDFRELTIDGQETMNRAWSEMDVVERWANVQIPVMTQISTSQVDVTLNNEFTVAVHSMSNENRSVISYQFTYYYSSYMMEYLGYDISGTASENGQIIVNDNESGWGVLYISFMSENPIDVSNSDLVKLKFRSIEWGQTWPQINDFYFNADHIWNVQNNYVDIKYYQKGDVDNNYMIQAYDAALTLQYSVGMDPLPMLDPLPWENWRIMSANVDNVEGVTANDAALILQYSARLIYSFDQDTIPGLRIPANGNVDVTIEKSGSNLIFKSVGNLIGLNVYADQHAGVLGDPVISRDVSLSAVNQENGEYAIGIVNLQPMADNTVLFTIPIIDAEAKDVHFNLIVNTDVRERTQTLFSGTEEISGNNLIIGPNPVTDQLNIQNLPTGSWVSVYDMTGKIVYSSSSTDMNGFVQVSSWYPGIYTVRVTGSDIQMNSKFIKR